MRSHPSVGRIRAGGCLAMLAAALIAGSASPALASGPAAVSVTPSTAKVGTAVRFTIRCTAGATAAMLDVTPLGLAPRIPMVRLGGELFQGAVVLPPTVKAGAYTIHLRCSNGASGTATVRVVGSTSGGVSGPVSSGTRFPVGTVLVRPSTGRPGSTEVFSIQCTVRAATATLIGTPLGLAGDISMRPASRGLFVVVLRLPGSISAGSFDVTMRCSDGHAGTAALTVRTLPAGPAQTGDGATSTATTSTLAFAGIGLLCFGAVLGGVAVRRRMRH